jgi:pimeloyl-ACP methyl ester carboxylesterase
MHVEMTRELARSGIASLRFDLAGIGDSLAAETGAPLLYGALSDDIAAAIDWLEKRGIRDLTVFGSCSGAYQAFHAAISDRRIKRIALVNQLCFVWGPAYAVQLETWRRTKAADVAARNNARNDAIAALSARGLMARLMPRAKQLTSPAQPTFSSAARCFGAARIWSSAGSPNYPGAARACCSSIPTTIQVWRSSNATWGRKDNARRQCPA